MPISGTLTLPTAANGFTLLELMLAMVIMGIALALGVAYYHPEHSTLEETAKTLVAQLSSSRADAMLARAKVSVILDGKQVSQLREDGKKRVLSTLPLNMRVALDNQSLSPNKPGEIVFGPAGYTTEYIVLLYTPEHMLTIYVPSIGAPIYKNGRYGLAELREMCQ